ncbi:hypothetical protein COU74_00965, partial [Candidatus Peregrinibacteria bacterium CG10_big_fil_rev_8_21_14_0_10_36_19]
QAKAQTNQQTNTVASQPPNGQNDDKGEGVAEKISNGHAWQKHSKDFDDIFTKKQLAEYIKKVFKNPSAYKKLSNGREAFWDSVKKRIIIKDPNHVDKGTIFKSSEKYFNKSLK